MVSVAEQSNAPTCGVGIQTSQVQILSDTLLCRCETTVVYQSSKLGYVGAAPITCLFLLM